MSRFQTLYDSLKQTLLESPDDMFVNAKKSHLYTFIYSPKAKSLIKEIISNLQKKYSSWDLDKLKTQLTKFLSQFGLDKPIMVFSNPAGHVFINNKDMGSDRNNKYLSHNTLVTYLILAAIANDDNNKSDLTNYGYLSYPFARYLGKSGRITTSPDLKRKFNWPGISFWSSSASHNDILNIINLSKSIIKYPDELGIEVNPFKDKHYSKGKLSSYSTSQNTKTKIQNNKTDDVIDAVRKRMFPDVPTESIAENIDDKLKEDIYKLFKLNNFNIKIAQQVNQPSLIATKHVVDNLKGYDVIPCEGRLNNYRYYFPIVEYKDDVFVLDLGNNFEGKIIPIVVPLNGNKYIIKQKFTKDNFLKNYKKLTKEYNI